MKKALLLVAAMALALLILLGIPVGKPQPPASKSADGAATFRLRVLVPRLALPFAGILPDAVVTHFDLTPSELGFDHRSPGAEGSVDPARLELRNAEGWDFSLVTDVESAITSKTSLVFPLGLGGTRRTLRCRPAANAVGHLQSAQMAGGERLEGRFLVELAHCEDALTGERVPWPASPLTVRGSFERLPSSPQ